MAEFPSIKPNSRSISLGNAPQLEYAAPSGANVRFLQGTKRVQQKLSMSFNAITESELYSIYDHYDGQEGSIIPFTLPAIVWGGYTTRPISEVDYEWRYAGSFTIAPIGVNRFSIQINLESVIV
jgi:hypothetical protein